MRCILFHFYIKPQPAEDDTKIVIVVSYSISTSNHNFVDCDSLSDLLYLIPFLHQTTTVLMFTSYVTRLYLIPFLHQTTTPQSRMIAGMGCILFHFYIKPQLQPCILRVRCVVSYSISTSNHNLNIDAYNRNQVVSYSISTSNHNEFLQTLKSWVLYLIPFLHQTTTYGA